MGDNSAIEWTDATWNPVTGCTKVSPGCKHCYAERLALRLHAMGNPRYRRGFDVTLHEDQLELPLRWKSPRRIFVNSMSDLFHDDVPVTFIERAFEVMGRAHWHVFQVLTKRAERLRELAPGLTWWPNVWQGVSVESSRYVGRIDALRVVPAAVVPRPGQSEESGHGAVCSSSHIVFAGSPKLARVRGSTLSALSWPWKMCQFTP